VLFRSVKFIAGIGLIEADTKVFENTGSHEQLAARNCGVICLFVCLFVCLL
jgi:hypothetical protein